MHFTYNAYADLIAALQKKKYTFSNYMDHPGDNFVILRHDVDFLPEKAYEFARHEVELNVRSTYFFLMRTDFYNIGSRKTMDLIRKIAGMGHTIGLHYDEKDSTPGETPGLIKRDCDLFSRITGVPVHCFSMHRPSKEIMKADFHIEGYTNSNALYYSTSCKYISDSRHDWKGNTIQSIASGEYSRLHILTHPIWYGDTDRSLAETLTAFCLDAARNRYNSLLENVRDLEKDLPADFLK